MVWGEPLWLLALILVPAVAGFVLLDALARRRSRMRFLRGEQPPLPRGWVPRFLVLPLVIALLVVALADPRWGPRTDDVERSGADIVLLLDLSRSMLAEDAHPSRLERAKREIRGLLSLLGDDRIALVSFAGNAEMNCPLTEDHKVFEFILDDIGVHSLANGGSELSRGLKLALEAFDDRSAGRAVILLTDGEFHGEDPSAMLAPYQEKRIPVYVIGVGTTDGAKIPISDDAGKRAFLKNGRGEEVISRLDHDILGTIASTTGGELLSTQDTAFPMDEIYEKRVRFLSAEAYASATMSQMPPRFQLPVFVALAILIFFWFPRRARKVSGVVLTSLVLLAPWSLARAEGQPVRPGHEELERRARDVSRHPADARYLYNYGTRLHEAGQHEQAAQVLEDAVGASRDRPVRGDRLLTRDAAYNLGNTLFRSVEREKDPGAQRQGLQNAVQAYAEALRSDPADDQARRNLALALRRLNQQSQQNQQGQQDQQDQQQQQQQDQQQQNQNQQQQNQQQQQDPQQQSQQQQQQQQDRKQQQNPQQPQQGQAQQSPQQQQQRAQQQAADERQLEEKLDEAERTQRQIDDWKARRRRRRGTNDW